jgi:streptogramin lyase
MVWKIVTATMITALSFFLPVPSTVPADAAVRAPLHEQYHPQPPSVTSYPDDAKTVTSLDVGPDGNIWFGGANNSDGEHPKPSFLGQLNPQTGKVAKFTVVSGNDGNAPQSIVNGPDGNLWFSYSSDGGTQYLATSTTGGSIKTFDVNISNPVVGPDGAIWGTRCGAGCSQWDVLSRVTLSGISSVVYLDDAGLGPFISGPDAELWYCTFTDIVAINVHGGLRKKYPVSSPCNGNANGTFHRIVYGPDGNIYSNADGGLTQTTPTGTMKTLFADADVLQLAADAVDGSIWYEDTGGHKLFEYILATGKRVTYTLPPETQATVFTVDHEHDGVWFAQSGVRKIYLLPLTAH